MKRSRSSATRSPTRARRRCRTPRSPSSGWRTSGATRRSTSPRTSFERLVRELPGEGFVGANVTVPHKGAALAVADSLSEAAREIGAANTLSFDGGEIHADNTDAAGAARRPARLAGGASGRWCSAPAAPPAPWSGRCSREGAEVEVWNRTELRSRNLCEELGGSPGRGSRRLAYGLIVNSTAVGLGGEDPFEQLPLVARRLRRPARSSSTWSTAASRPRCCEAAEVAGAATVDGIEILVRQGALSFRIWTGREPSLADRDALRSLCVIICVGMGNG